MPRVIVGLGGLLSDPACCVLKDGQLASAVEQAKVSRQDRPGSFPEEAFAMALEAAGVKADEVEGVALARPFALGAEGGTQIDLRTRFPRSEIHRRRASFGACGIGLLCVGVGARGGVES